MVLWFDQKQATALKADFQAATLIFAERESRGGFLVEASKYCSSKVSAGLIIEL